MKKPMAENEEHPLISYCRSVAEEFNSRLNRVRNFVTNHNLTSGNANESILRDFLALHSPANFEVASGFICNLFPQDETPTASKQCDILVFDRAKYPLVFSEGTLRFVNHRSVRMVVEVKTKLDSVDEIISAIENIASVRNIVPREDVEDEGNNPYNFERRTFFIFAFNSLKQDKMIEHFHSHLQKPHSQNPTAIFLFEEEVIIYQQFNWLNNKEGDVKYNIVKANKEDIITFLFLSFLYSVGDYKDQWYQFQLWGLVGGWLEREGNIIAEDIVFGKK